MCKYCWQLCWQLLKCFSCFTEANTMVPDWKELDLKKQIMKLYCGFSHTEHKSLLVSCCNWEIFMTEQWKEFLWLIFSDTCSKLLWTFQEKKKKGVLIDKMNKLENISEKPEIITIFFHHINFQPFSILGICWPHCTSKDICSVHAHTTEFVAVERKSHPYTYFSENLRIYQTNQQHSPAFLRGEYEVFPW